MQEQIKKQREEMRKKIEEREDKEKTQPKTE
jgi:hypothetical protein